MPDLKALLERVEKATEPDRELDAAIMCAILGTTHTADDLIYHSVPRAADECLPGTYWRKSRSGASLHTAPGVTSSIDAALALVAEKLPGAYWYICAGRARVGEPLYGAQIVDHDANGVSHDEPLGIAEHDHSAALAILAALLRALIAQEAKADA